jgi:hypothetical protein
MLVNIYPEPGVGQRIHLYYVKKIGTGFLGHNGLNPAYGQFYVLTVLDHGTWDNMAAEQTYWVLLCLLRWPLAPSTLAAPQERVVERQQAEPDDVGAGNDRDRRHHHQPNRF